MSIAHELKCWPEFFEAIIDGRKTHELRRSNDRNFEVGQILRLNEFDPKRGYTGRSTDVEVTYITAQFAPCAFSQAALTDGYCILSIKKPSSVGDTRNLDTGGNVEAAGHCAGTTQSQSTGGCNE